MRTVRALSIFDRVASGLPDDEVTSHQSLHIVGGGMAGSEAAWAAAQRRARRGPARDAPQGRHLRAPDRQAGRDGLLQLLPLRRRRTERGRAAALGDARGRVADHAGRRPAPAARGRRAGRRPRGLFGLASPSSCAPCPTSRVVEEEVTALPDDGHWIFATGPLTSDALGAAILAETGAERLAFFDAIAPDRPCRQHRHGHGLGAVALRQGRDRGRAHAPISTAR